MNLRSIKSCNKNPKLNLKQESMNIPISGRKIQFSPTMVIFLCRKRVGLTGRVKLRQRIEWGSK